MVPEQRLLLEVAFDALHNAGLSAGDLAATPVGVFVGGMPPAAVCYTPPPPAPPKPQGSTRRLPPVPPSVTQGQGRVWRPRGGSAAGGGSGRGGNTPPPPLSFWTRQWHGW